MTSSPPEPDPADTAALDAMILAAATADACKVAVLISRSTDAAKAAGLTVAPQTIAARIYALSGTGQLAVAGNVRRWRAAEVRRGT